MSVHQPTDPVIVVTSDSHVGPLPEQLREHCPKSHLDEFDAFYRKAAEEHLTIEMPDVSREELLQTSTRNMLTDGGWDAEARFRDMDRDGVAADVIFHGLNLGEHVHPIPWSHQIMQTASYDQELLGLGRKIYNRWLADFCSIQPERRAGMAQLPMWDPEAALEELKWAADAGLRGVNFPRSQPGITPYNDPVWEPFWSFCEERTLPLTCHAQTTPATKMMGGLQGDFFISILEMRNQTLRQGLHELVYGGVFERHPKLSYVLTEVTGLWWKETMDEMDEQILGAEMLHGIDRTMLGMPKLPSEYCGSQVYMGATCLAPFEYEDALLNGYATQVLYGSDYPHPEGSWAYPRSDDDPSITKLVLRDTLWNADPDVAALIAGESAARVYGLDLDKLRKVADRINSITFEELGQPVPDDLIEPLATRGAYHAFRRHGWMT